MALTMKNTLFILGQILRIIYWYKDDGITCVQKGLRLTATTTPTKRITAHVTRVKNKRTTQRQTEASTDEKKKN